MPTHDYLAFSPLAAQPALIRPMGVAGGNYGACCVFQPVLVARRGTLPPRRLPPSRHVHAVRHSVLRPIRRCLTPLPAQAATATQPSSASPAADVPATPAHTSLTLAEVWALLQPDMPRLIACTVATACSVASFVVVAPCLGGVVDVISRGTAASPAALTRSIGLLTAAYLGSTVGLAAQVWLALALGEGLAHRLRCRLFGALLQRDAVFFETAPTGQLMQWLGSDIELLQVCLLSGTAGGRGKGGGQSVCQCAGLQMCP